MFALKGFLVMLNHPHYVNEFNSIDGVVYSVETEEDVKKEMADYIEYMKNEEEIDEFSYHIINLETGQDNLYTHRKDEVEG